MRLLLYVSSVDSLDDIHPSVLSNLGREKEKQISGFTEYARRHFLQVLEGPSAAIDVIIKRLFNVPNFQPLLLIDVKTLVRHFESSVYAHSSYLAKNDVHSTEQQCRFDVLKAWAPEKCDILELFYLDTVRGESLLTSSVD